MAMSEIHSSEHANALPGESGRRRSWPVGVPPMWLSKPRKPGAGRAAQPPAPVSRVGPPPRLLGLWRALVGIMLLGLAWAGLVLVAIFGSMVLPLLHSRRLTPTLLIYALGAIGVAWVAAVALCCIVTGAFCLSLAITRANWE
jgi:hypothetical protein